jgi:hypothetical protein
MVSLSMLRSLLYLFPQLLKKLWLWLILLFQRWRRRTKQAEEPLVSIRALYRYLLGWVARQGMAPIPSQTPLEYLVTIKEKFPQRQDDLEKITDGYLLARYSKRSISQEEFDSIKEAWRRVVSHDAQ